MQSPNPFRKNADTSQLRGNVSASTLRHWEQTLEVDVPRDALGQRTYPPERVEYFRQVKALLDA